MSPQDSREMTGRLCTVRVCLSRCLSPEGVPTVVDLVLLYFFLSWTFYRKKEKNGQIPFLETECGFCALTTSSHVRFVESVLCDFSQKCNKHTQNTFSSSSSRQLRSCLRRGFPKPSFWGLQRNQVEIPCDENKLTQKRIPFSCFPLLEIVYILTIYQIRRSHFTYQLSQMSVCNCVSFTLLVKCCTA